MANIKFIAHRGNYNGIQPAWENTSDYLEFAFYDKKHDVECDLILHKGILYYGHDEPVDTANLGFIQQQGVWCHAKTLETLEELLKMRTNCFWHEQDTVTLTSEKYIWCFPGNFPRNKRAVWLDLEGIPLPQDTTGIYGICGDCFDTK